MKRELRRIEETLSQLTIRMPVLATNARSLEPSLPSKAPSFEVQAKAAAAAPHAAAPYAPAPSPTAIALTPAAKAFVRPFTVEQPAAKTPNLPKFKAPTFTSHRNGTNPALATNLLREIQVTVEGWQTELHQVLRQIQDLYLEGPIVDGWLESHSREPEIDSSVLRHAEVDRLLDYVEEICSTQDHPTAAQSPRTGYRLCGLNADGQLWSCSCPPEQVPSLSLAIARHQKLRQLLGRKQHLELRLNHLAETLVVMHSHLQE